MLKVEAITQTENPEVVKVELVQVMSALDLARGFGKPKRIWLPADKASNTFVVGQTFNQNIKMVQHDTPQYEGHKPFEKTGKYYTPELTD